MWQDESCPTAQSFTTSTNEAMPKKKKRCVPYPLVEGITQRQMGGKNHFSWPLQRPWDHLWGSLDLFWWHMVKEAGMFTKQEIQIWHTPLLPDPSPWFLPLPAQKYAIPPTTITNSLEPVDGGLSGDVCAQPPGITLATSWHSLVEHSFCQHSHTSGARLDWATSLFLSTFVTGLFFFFQ